MVPWSRDLLSYQEFFVAGTLVALHFDEVCAFVARHTRKIFMLCGAIGGLMVLWYAIQVDMGASLVRASDPTQAEAVIWYFAAIAAMFAVSLWWDSRPKRPSSPHRPGWTTWAGLAAMTGGVWLSHNLFLTSLRSVLGATGLRASLPWEATVAVLFVGTVLISGTFVSLILRTRLRWVLGGPVRAEQRAEYDALRTTSVSAAAQPAGENAHGVRRLTSARSVRSGADGGPSRDHTRRCHVRRVGPHGAKEVEGAGPEREQHDHKGPAQTGDGMTSTQQV